MSHLSGNVVECSTKRLISASLALAFWAYCGSYAGEMRAASELQNSDSAPSISAETGAIEPAAFEGVNPVADDMPKLGEIEKTGPDGLSFYFNQLGTAIRQRLNIGLRVESTLTPWAEPWNYNAICHRMNQILIDAGISSKSMRIRMIAHAVVASGWRQQLWNYNAWGVQQGSWSGPWFIRSTQEVDDDGQYYMVWDAAWRSFSNWQEAIDDFTARISAKSNRDPYRQAYRYLKDPSYRADAAYWDALKAGRYYTAQHFTSKRFAILCWRVRNELRKGEEG